MLITNTIPAKVFQNDPDVYAEMLNDQFSHPLVIVPKKSTIDALDWIKTRKDAVDRALLQYGSILFRGFPLRDADAFNQFVAAYGASLIDYKERSSPRHEVSKRIYTSTDHPADQVINMHNENSYSRTWPLKLFFYCAISSKTGGETPIADSREMLNYLSESTKAKFREKGVMYIRNLGGVLGLDWREVFQTSNPQQVEEYCNKNNIKFEWADNSRLKLKYFSPAIRRHPITNEEVWFNHAFFFNILSLDPQFVEEILTVMSKEDFSFLSYYGDGEEIEESVIDEIRTGYEALKVYFRWQQGDLLLVDNMLNAHGRSSYEGERKILVAMCEPQHDQSFV